MEQGTHHPVPATITLPVGLVAEVQDALLMVMTDLHRLGGLLDHAAAQLLARFDAADLAVRELAQDEGAPVDAIRQALQQAVTELQFHDLATQLLTHTGRMLQGCASRLADQAMSTEDDEIPAPIDPMPERPSPVTQSEMDAGTIELF
jgi:hypothetical protein